MILSEYDEFLIGETNTLIQAMEKLDHSGQKVLFVVEDGVLRASLSDGDVRRWILKKGNLDAPVSEMANYHPRSIAETDIKQANSVLAKNRIGALPVLNETGKVCGIYFRDGLQIKRSEENLPIPTVIMAGGKGTRLYPYTKILPKPLIPIGDIPISELIINHLHKQGCKEFYMILNYKKNMIKAYFNDVDKDYSLGMIDEETPLGTGGGLSLLRGKIQGTFLFTNCDTLITENLGKAYRTHKEKGNVITMICSAKNYVIPYGVIQLDEQGRIDEMQEKPQLPFLVNTGSYIVEPSVLDMIAPDTEITFPEIIGQCMENGQNVGIYPIGENQWMDMGQMGEMESMKKRMGIDE